MQQIGIVISIFLVMIMATILIIGTKRAKKWKFNPSEYQFTPDRKHKWNLNIMLHEMTDWGVLWVISIFYLFMFLLIEIVLVVAVPNHLIDASFYGMVIAFPFISIGILVGVVCLIRRKQQGKDYVKLLLVNSLPYVNVEKSVLESILENEIKDGILIHTKRVNFTQNYIFITKSRMKFSPIAIELKNIAQINYVGHNRGGIFIAEAVLKDGRKIEISFNRLPAYKFITMISYFGIQVKW